MKTYRLVLLASLWLENSQEFFISSWDVLFSTSHANLALKHTLGSNPLISALPGNFPLRSFSHSIFFSWFISLECFYWGNLKNLLECSLILKIFINMKNYHEFKKCKCECSGIRNRSFSEKSRIDKKLWEQNSYHATSMKVNFS